MTCSVAYRGHLVDAQGLHPDHDFNFELLSVKRTLRKSHYFCSWDLVIIKRLIYTEVFKGFKVLLGTLHLNTALN